MRSASADAVVIGAGVVGASVAFHLAQTGLRVVVVDRGEVAAGATGVSAGFIRTFHPSQPALTPVAQASLPDFAGWPDIVGGSIGFSRTGCLHRIDAPSHGPGVDAGEWEVLDALDLRDRYPRLHLPEAVLAVHEPDAGYAAPWLCADLYLRRVIEWGGSVWTGNVALKVTAERGRATGVVTSGGVLSAGVVVVAAGSRLSHSSLLDLDVALRPKRIVTQRVAIPCPSDGLPAYVEEGDDSLFFRPDGPFGLLVGGGEGKWRDLVEGMPSFPSRSILRDLLLRLEGLVAVPVVCREVVSGLDAYTPDGLPLIDRVPTMDGAFVATGFSGTGFKTAPAVGRMLAAWIVGGAQDERLAPFSLGRFKLAQPAGASRGALR